MKFMKLGNRPDCFYTEVATRTVISDVPSDVTIRIKNITYLLHKYPLLPKCGLLQQLFSEANDPDNVILNLNDIPGGDEAFELCAKFCYGITINLSAHNFVSAFCAAKFLRMTEAVENGNFVMKLETFFSSCVLEGWKDSVATLKNTERVYELSENFGIVRRCIESIVDKILTTPTKVTWSYTYTRPGYDKKQHTSVPKDWWTEDISFLGIDMFRCIVTSIQSTNILQPQLIGEALHVYACRSLPETTSNETSTSKPEELDSLGIKRRILETIVSLIPLNKGSVSIKFLLRLLKTATFLGVSPVAKAELLRLAGLQLDEAMLNDLILIRRSLDDDPTCYDIELVKTVLESFLRQWRRHSRGDERESLRSLRKVGKLIDSYMQMVAKDGNVPFEEVVSLAETLPGVARPEHDELYKAIHIYLKEHPDLSKAARKQLCRLLDCQKLSPEVRAHAVKNELLPLRTVVQLLFFEQENSNVTTDKMCISPKQVKRDDLIKLKLGANKESPKAKVDSVSAPSTSRVHPKLSKEEEETKLRPELSFKVREVTKPEIQKESEIREEENFESKLNLRQKFQVRRISENIYSKGSGK